MTVRSAAPPLTRSIARRPCIRLLGLWAGTGRLPSSKQRQFERYTAAGLYHDARKALEDNDYETAIKQYEALTARYPFTDETRQARLDLICVVLPHGREGIGHRCGGSVPPREPDPSARRLRLVHEGPRSITRTRPRRSSAGWAWTPPSARRPRSTRRSRPSAPWSSSTRRASTLTTRSADWSTCATAWPSTRSTSPTTTCGAGPM